jgi:heme/copper-type cytochrome/quinol oxidase subunit 3
MEMTKSNLINYGFSLLALGGAAAGLGGSLYVAGSAHVSPILDALMCLFISAILFISRDAPAETNFIYYGLSLLSLGMVANDLSGSLHVAHYVQWALIMVSGLLSVSSMAFSDVTARRHRPSFLLRALAVAAALGVAGFWLVEFLEFVAPSL